MRFTIVGAAFAIAALLPISAHAAEGGAGGEAGALGEAGELGSVTAPSGGSAGSAGKGGAAGATPAPALHDPGTASTGVSCSIAGPNGDWGMFGTTVALGAAFWTLRRRARRPHV
jgi:hypothetical protein